MSTTDKSKPILITGGSGYIASWIIKFLLEDGYIVRATVRDKKNTDKVKHLLNLEKSASGKLELWEADLLVPGSFEKAMENCEVVMHTASPFIIGKVKDPKKQFLDPALDGTRNVLNTAKSNPTVKRIVLTSSVASIYGDNIDIQQTNRDAFNENDWNTTSSLDHSPYSYSKVMAEKEAWKIAETQEQWDLVVINPSFVLGPSLSGRIDSASMSFMLDMINGKLKFGVPHLELGCVDVRDVAKAHIIAAMEPQASGRHILSASTHSMLEIAKVIESEFPKQFKTPKMTVPKALLYIAGPSQGLTWKYIKNNIGHGLKLDNSYSKKDLKIKYTSIDTTIKDHILSIQDFNLI